jgi:hypothetical protein
MRTTRLALTRVAESCPRAQTLLDWVRAPLVRENWPAVGPGVSSRGSAQAKPPGSSYPPTRHGVGTGSCLALVPASQRPFVHPRRAGGRRGSEQHNVGLDVITVVTVEVTCAPRALRRGSGKRLRDCERVSMISWRSNWRHVLNHCVHGTMPSALTAT